MAGKAGITPRQVNFAVEYLETCNASEAYRTAYNTGNMQAKTVWEAASRLLHNSKVVAKIEEIRKGTMLTVDDILEEFEEAREVAKNNDNASAMVAATAGKAKVLGLDKLTLAGDKDNPLRIVQGMTEIELHEELQRIQLRLTSIDA